MPIELDVVDPPTDLDGDGDTDLRDAAAFLACHTGESVDLPPECEVADFNGDGAVNLGDFPAIPFTLAGPR